MKVIGATLKRFGSHRWEARLEEHPDVERGKGNTWADALGNLTRRLYKRGKIPPDCVAVETKESAQRRFVATLGGHFDGPHPEALFIPATPTGRHDDVVVETYAKVAAMPSAIGYAVRRWLRGDPPDWHVQATCPNGHVAFEFEGSQLPQLAVVTNPCRECEGFPIKLTITPRVAVVPENQRGDVREVEP